MEREKDPVSIRRSVVSFYLIVPKKNYEAVIDFQKQLNDVFKKHGVTNRQVFHAGEVEMYQGLLTYLILFRQTRNELNYTNML